MKRDLRVIRDILLAVEAAPDLRGIGSNSIEDHPPDLASYNMSLLIEAGFVDGAANTSYGPAPMAAVANKLTWQGHELLDAIRADTIWARVSEAVKKAGSWTLSSVLTIATDLATEALKHALRPE